MGRFLIGLTLGTFLTVESLLLSEAGHGSYAPWLFTASLFALVPLVSFVAGPMLWATYCMLIPNLETAQARLISFLIVATIHVVSGAWLAFEDPAFLRLNQVLLAIFLLTFVTALGYLFGVTFRSKLAMR